MAIDNANRTSVRHGCKLGRQAAASGISLLVAALMAAAALGCGSYAPEDANAATIDTASVVNAAAVNGTYLKPGDALLRSKLTSLQYDVTQNDGTEMAFQNVYWNNHAAGIYVDVVSGEPLFSSLDKYDSHTGWPSFTKPLAPENIKRDADRSFGFPRVEIRSVHANSHLGHVFSDGPPPLGLRYCMNSAALKFIPVSKLEADGYGKYLSLFQ